LKLSKKLVITISLLLVIASFSTIVISDEGDVDVYDLVFTSDTVDTWYSATSIDNQTHVYTYGGGLNSIQGMTANDTWFFTAHSDEIEYREHDGTYEGTFSDSGTLLSGTGTSKMAGMFHKDGFLYIACTTSDHSGNRPGAVVKCYPNNFTRYDWWDMDVLGNDLERGVNAVAFLNGYWYVGESSYATSGTFHIDVFDMDWNYVKNAGAFTDGQGFHGFNGFSVYEDCIYAGDHSTNYHVLRQNSDLTLTHAYTIDTYQASSQDSTFVGDTFYYTNRSNGGVDSADFVRTPTYFISYNTNFEGGGYVNKTDGVRINYTVKKNHTGVLSTILSSNTSSFNGSNYWETTEISGVDIALGDTVILEAQAVNDSNPSINLSSVVTVENYIANNTRPYINQINLVNDSGDLKIYFKPEDAESATVDGVWWFNRERNGITKTVSHGELNDLTSGVFTTAGLLEAVNFTVTDTITGFVVLNDSYLFGTTYGSSDTEEISSFNFTDICGLGNNTDLASFGSVRWGNSTAPTIDDIDDPNAGVILNVTYQVRVANDSGFTDVFINETGLDQWWNLTEEVPYLGSHYYDYRARVKVRSN